MLISADYSQIEFRVLAHLADDPVLVDAFQGRRRLPRATAVKIFGADSGRDPHDLRSTAKMVNYALLYGKTAFTLAKDIGVTPQEAQAFIDAYFAGFPRVRAFIDRTLEDARASGVVRTLFGRRRLVPDLNSKNVQIRQAAEREAVNMPIQGTAADILKLAMIDVPTRRSRDSDSAHDSHRARRVAVRGGRGTRRRDRRAVRERMQGAARRRAVDRRCRYRCELERRETLRPGKSSRFSHLLHFALNASHSAGKRLGWLADGARPLGNDRALHQPVDVASEGARRARGASAARTHAACAAAQRPAESPWPRAAAAAQ